jgi:hypothetical protein
MMIAQIVQVDWSSSAALLLALGGVGFLAKWVMSAPMPDPTGKLILTELKPSPAPKGRTTYEPAPEGFAQHAEEHCAAAPGASAEIRLNYILEGYTEAQTLRAEVERLSVTKTEPIPVDVKESL